MKNSKPTFSHAEDKDNYVHKQKQAGHKDSAFR